jgi:glutaredoxin 3
LCSTRPPIAAIALAAKSLLERKGLSYAEIDVSGDFAKREEMAARAFGRRTVPQIFIEDRHIAATTKSPSSSAKRGSMRFSPRSRRYLHRRHDLVLG